MTRSARSLACAAGFFPLAIAAAIAAPTPAPAYTFCELECFEGDDGIPRGDGFCLCNDLCFQAQVINASLAVASVGGNEDLRDCFYITGKLQADCVWSIEPKCAMRAYGKPLPCRTASGAIIQGAFYEPSLATSNALGVINNLVPNDDRTVRIGIAAFADSLDGTINGLINNGAHLERGEVTVKVVYNGDDGQPRGGEDSYVFSFCYGADAGRVAFIIPAGVPSVNVICCDDTGQQKLGWDVDHYLLTNLIPSAFYSLTVVGGALEAGAYSDIPAMAGAPSLDGLGDLVCDIKPPFAIGWFNKNCHLISCDTRGPLEKGPDFPRLYFSAEADGSARIAISGGAFPFLHGRTVQQIPQGDCNFNGFEDTLEDELATLLQRINILENASYMVLGSVSLKDCTASLVTRFPRAIWDEYFEEWNSLFYYPFFAMDKPLSVEPLVAHNVVADYTLKIELAQHVDPGQRPTFPPTIVINGARADVNSDGHVNASDLALLLSFWGQGPN